MADAHIEGELIEEEVDILTDSGDELEGHVNDTISFGAQPYLFEPEVSDGDGDDPDNEMEVLVEEGAGPRENEWRLDDLSWCHCNQCPLMETAQQCKCCHEMLRMMAKLDRLRDEAPGQEIPVCITQHPGFQAVCLNRYVLQTAYSVYKVRHGHKPGSLPEKYRYTAYRQLVRWCYGFCPKDLRMVLPACAVSQIRQAFPSEDGNYTGFQLPNLD